MKKLLLHVCCGPCGIYPLEKLQTDYQISVFYYNPNIHPEEEYKKRKTAAQEFCKKNKINFIEPEYDPQKYFQAVKGLEKNKFQRCAECYKLRLEQTAKYAAENNFDVFTSTLLISPHQDINLVKKIGQELAEKYKINFYSAQDKDNNKKYKGFRPGFTQGRKKAKQENMYSQTYCGCIFSKDEV